MHVCFIRKDERRRDVADGKPLVFVVVSDRHHHFRRFHVRHAHARQYFVREERAALRVIGAVDAVADIVQISGDFRKFHPAFVRADALKDLARPLADDARMSDRMFGKAKRFDLAFRHIHDRFNFLVVSAV